MAGDPGSARSVALASGPGSARAVALAAASDPGSARSMARAAARPGDGLADAPATDAIARVLGGGSIPDA